MAMFSWLTSREHAFPKRLHDCTQYSACSYTYRNGIHHDKHDGKRLTQYTPSEISLSTPSASSRYVSNSAPIPNATCSEDSVWARSRQLPRTGSILRCRDGEGVVITAPSAPSGPQVIQFSIEHRANVTWLRQIRAHYRVESLENYAFQACWEQ